MNIKTLINVRKISIGAMGDLALAIALESRWHERQWQVPKAWAGILLGCRAVGDLLDESLFVSRVES